MMEIKKMKPGQVVYDVGRTKMGNTNMSTVSVWDVVIVDVDPAGQWVIAKWNVCNPPQRYSARQVKRWRAKKPVLIRTSTYSQRLATREELKAMRENADKTSETDR